MTQVMDLDTRRRMLTDRKSELLARLTEIDAELDAQHSKDWEELATEREGDEVLESMGAAGKAEIVMINAALGRIDDGEYGYCSNCGEEITKERLDVLPYTPVCRDCAAKQAAHHRP